MSVVDRSVDANGRYQAVAAGMKVDRVFSSPTCEPFDSVLWEKRTAAIKDSGGKVVFQQHDCEVPKQWSQLATDVVVSKYFYGRHGTPQRETSVRQLVHRVTRTLTDWGRADGYFASNDDAERFYDELTVLCLNQYGAFNSPVWFNLGLSQQYGITGPNNNWRWDEEETKAVRAGDAFKYPQGSACFIQSVEDDMESIMNLAKSEAMLFKFGSGSGSDLTPLRSSREFLSGGGKPSGPLGFMRVYDATASIVLSGGRCLAPYQPVFTAAGVSNVQQLAESGKHFIVLSYSNRLGRVAAKTAQAWQSGHKPVVAVTTDKGEFHVSADHPMMLRTGRAICAAQLQPGMSLMPVTTDNQDGYVRVGLQNGAKGKETLHRMVARDVMGLNIKDHVVHHDDEDKTNCDWTNLVLTDHQEHGRIHGKRSVARGTHIFKHRKFPKRGQANGMSQSAPFWSDSQRVAAYLKRQSDILSRSGRARGMQAAAARQKMLDTGYELINRGHDISTFDGYARARKAAGQRCPSVPGQLKKFELTFGSYEAFYKELRSNNHKVVSVRPVGIMPVYSVEVFDDEPDDKRRWSEHNYTLAPLGTTTPFMQGVVCLNTRRAAKMQTIRAHHPDIVEFIECKTKEDKKALALMAAGYSGGMDGEAYCSVLYQNSNLSVRVTDAFLRAAESGDDWCTHAVTTGAVVETHKASTLLDRIAEGTWICGDPGLQYEDTIQRWHTCPNTAPINSSNPCSEYMFIDDSACNLASINLLKFRRPDGSFDVDGLRAAVRIFITAQEILVDHASYPTEKIAANSHKFRPLGLGYANLGSLLMASGLPYDSDQARAVAASITALLHGQAYLTSAAHAGHIGPFEGFALNREPMLRVMGQHAAAADQINAAHLPACYNDLKLHAVELWAEVLQAGREHGYRNSQATVLAPTGTIAFMMDCDTTGVEPDVALVKFKQLAGGGELKIINRMVGPALDSLGYGPALRDEIVQRLEQTGDIEGTGVKPEHLDVFDCAFSSNPGGRCISFRGHLRMMSAVQPFISGAISKTCNVPNESSIADIRVAYLEGWKLGLKAMAIYRDNSKGIQVVSTKSDRDSKIMPIREAIRERLPDTRKSINHKFKITGNTGYINVGFYDDGRPGELFITMSKTGSTVQGLMDTIGAAVSIGLQSGVPMGTFVRKFTHSRFEPAGLTTNKEIPLAKSIIDYIFTWLGLRCVPGFQHQVQRHDDEDSPLALPSPDERKNMLIGPECSNCHTIMVPAGRCHRCLGCGATNGSCG